MISKDSFSEREKSIERQSTEIAVAQVVSLISNYLRADITDLEVITLQDKLTLIIQ